MNLKRPLIITNLIILIILLAAGFWPLGFKPANKVYRIKHDSGVILNGNSIIYEQNNTGDIGLLSYLENTSLTIEFRLKPCPATNDRLSCILSFYDDKDPELFMLAKWKSGLILRRRFQQPSGSYSYHEVGIPTVFFSNRTSMIAITMNGECTTVYIDGKKSAVFHKYILSLNNEDLVKTRMIIGNEPRVKIPWEGEINGLALYKSAISTQNVSNHYTYWKNSDFKSLSKDNGIIALYPMNEGTGPLIRNIVSNKNNLIIPDHLFAIKKTFFSLPWIGFWRNPIFYYDLLQNIFGLIPFGFFLCALFISFYKIKPSLIYAMTIITGSGISFSIELIQGYMPARSSSLTDFICNIIGTLLGVILFHKAYKINLSKMKKPDVSGFSIKVYARFLNRVCKSPSKCFRGPTPPSPPGSR